MREIFIKYLENNQNIIQKLFLKNIINKLKSEKQLKLFEKVILYYPTWDFMNLNIEFFNDEYIECYGIDFLVKNIKDLQKIYLDYGIKDDDIKERIILIDKLNIPFDNINSKLLLSEIVTNDDIIKISELLKNKTLSYFICNNCIDNKKDFDIILKINDKNSNYYKLINILLNKFEQKEYNEFKKILYKNNISDYINFFENIDVSWFDRNTSFDNLLNIYDKNKQLFNDIYNNKNMKYINNNLKIYFYDNLIDLISIKDLNNIRILRYEVFKNLIDKTDNIDEIKTLITKCYFNLEYNPFKDKINEIRNTIKEGLKFNNQDIQFFRILEYFINLNDKNNLIKLYNELINIPFIYEYVEKLEKKQKKFCFKDITNSLTNVGNGFQVIEFNGQDFNFLIHKIKGYGNHKFANKLYSDPSLWDKNFIEDSYISTSLITNDYFGCVPGTGYILAFNNIDSSSVNDMGAEDIYSSIISCKNNIRHQNSKIMTSKTLIKNCKKTYNEIVIKRYKNDKAIVPSAVVVFDKITEKDISVAKHFNVPIYLINREKYLSKMIKKCNEFLNNDDFENYCNCRLKIALSFNNNPKIMNKYFSMNNLNENTDLIINKIVNKLKDAKNNEEKEHLKNCLKKMIKVNYKINSIMMYNDITYKNYEFDEENIEKKLNVFTNY